MAVTDHLYDDLDRHFRATVYLPVAGGGNRIGETDYFADGSVKAVRRGVATALAQTYASYTYTANGRLATVADAKNNLTSYTYDGHDRRDKTFYPDKASAGVSSSADYEQYGYDANGNVTSERRRSGNSLTNTYDNLNRPSGRLYPVAANNVTYGYDLLGRRTSANLPTFGIGYAYDNAGRLQSSTAGGRTLAYQYDAAGNRRRVTWPDGFYATYDYDALNRPINIKENGVTGLVALYSYDDLSRRATATLGNGTASSYSYGDQATLTGLAHDLGGTAQDIAFAYTPNQAREVAQHSWNNDLYQWKGYANGSRNATPNGLNQYTGAAGATLGYDANGNLAGDGVWAYGYDDDNRLRSAGSAALAAALAYDGASRLRLATIAGVSTQLLYDGTDLVAEYDAAGTLLRRYVHGPGADEPVVWYEGAATTNKNWLYADHLGSVIATANAAGAATSTLSYGPYGEPNQSAGPRFRYTGQQSLAQLNLYYYKARMYSPALGRFLQTDPIGYGDNMNLYAYVEDNPINNVDPTGLLSFDFNKFAAQIEANRSDTANLAALVAAGSIGTMPKTPAELRGLGVPKSELNPYTSELSRWSSRLGERGLRDFGRTAFGKALSRSATAGLIVDGFYNWFVIGKAAWDATSTDATESIDKTRKMK
ncbi:RHS repeat-associated core domain-containing protein [Rugamonas sp. DEMB1]|uniref:RHS repeat-associated core domain-containing protein n=1 Tax=Rugamonas sp. DEMB1 TaxID=3039386 RepID=UPI00244C94EB|nr:RHS repeat-associated core domain-containing protein [Rugamonas sp. DEMB1]WGG52878.1 RHS repeat-associated core domain-containing protein [Rugamonas sp. DEMB1]